jgi:hypothetical protein
MAAFMAAERMLIACHDSFMSDLWRFGESAWHYRLHFLPSCLIIPPLRSYGFAAFVFLILHVALQP